MGPMQKNTYDLARPRRTDRGMIGPRRLEGLAMFLAVCALAAPAAQASRHVAVGDVTDELRVPTVSFAALADKSGGFDASVLRDAMTTDGIVAVTGIPNFASLRRAVMLDSARCGAEAPASRTTTFEDGTARRTFAGITRGVDDSRAIEFGDVNAETSCSDPRFKARLADFRGAVSSAAGAFASRMSELFPTAEGQPLLWDFPHKTAFRNLDEVVRAAEHLEHFHAYHRPEGAAAAEPDATTIDLHADQGLFIGFTPGLVVQTSGDASVAAEVAGADAGMFVVERPDGTRARADFGPDGDIVVFMLGDGVDQIVNPRMPEGVRLRSAPHAMSMPRLARNQARMWYGRMFLPPAEALSEPHGVTFGELRRRAVEDVHEGGGVGRGLGCSRALLENEGTQCKDNQMYCWMRCMDHTPAINPKACEDKGLKLQCLSQRNQVWRLEDSHGDYNPTCSNSNDNVTPPPKIPARAGTCNGTFAPFLAKESYPNSIELVKGKFYLQWRVASGVLEARMAYDGVVGWMALGVENPGGGHNGMNGAKTVMGINDADKDIFGAPFVGTGVHEYKIHDRLSAFRHWQTPLAPANITGAEMNVTACHTAMKFTTAHAIGGEPLHLADNGKNVSLIWAVHPDTFLKGYHGWGNRGHLVIDFAKPHGHKAWKNPYGGGGGHSGHSGHSDGGGHSPAAGDDRTGAESLDTTTFSVIDHSGSRGATTASAAALLAAALALVDLFAIVLEY